MNELITKVFVEQPLALPAFAKNTRTDFKYIGKVESHTNNLKKISSCSFYMIFFSGSLIYMPNYSGKKIPHTGNIESPDGCR